MTKSQRHTVSDSTTMCFIPRQYSCDHWRSIRGKEGASWETRLGAQASGAHKCTLLSQFKTRF